MNVIRNVVTTVTVELTEEQVKKLGGLLQAVDTVDPFFSDLACELDAVINEFCFVYVNNDDGQYEQQQEEV